MGLWPFGRKRTDDKSVETLLAQSEAASPTGRFRLAVEDVFMITGRGVVVTGRVESGSTAIGRQVTLLRDGGVVATSRINGIEKFRAVTDIATAGENVGLLLDALTKDQVHRGDIVEG